MKFLKIKQKGGQINARKKFLEVLVDGIAVLGVAAMSITPAKAETVYIEKYPLYSNMAVYCNQTKVSEHKKYVCGVIVEVKDGSKTILMPDELVLDEIHVHYEGGYIKFFPTERITLEDWKQKKVVEAKDEQGRIWKMILKYFGVVTVTDLGEDQEKKARGIMFEITAEGPNGKKIDGYMLAKMGVTLDYYKDALETVEYIRSFDKRDPRNGLDRHSYGDRGR